MRRSSWSGIIGTSREGGRLGIQQRGAWHFHLPLFVPSSFGPLKEPRRFVSSSWHEVTGELSEGHLRAGTRVEAVRR